MSIIAYVGLPGSGKSYGVVENVILPALEAGRTIKTNIPLRKGYLDDDYPNGRVETFTNQQAREEGFWDIDEHEHGVIWVIDEAWRFWQGGMKASQIPEREKQFFTEHRHCVGEGGHTTEIVLSTQDTQQMCSFVRDLIEETYRAVKLTALGQKNKYRVDVHQGAFKLAAKGQALRQLYGVYKPEVYKYYRSHTHNKTDFAAGMEEKADDRSNLLKSWRFRVVMPLALVIMGFCIYKAVSYFDREPEQPGQPEVQPENRPAAQQNGQIVKADRRRPERTYQSRFELEAEYLPVSDKWRIVGEVNGVYWVWGEHGTRKIHSRVCGKTKRTGEPFCVIGGKLVTYYSYKRPDQPENSRDYISPVSDSVN